MVKKNKRKSKKNKLPKEFIMSKKDVKAYQKSLINKKSTKKKETKIFWIVMAALFIGSVSLAPELWQRMGENIWVALPVIGILAFYSMNSGEKKSDGGSSFNLVGLGFIIIILIFAILSAF